jgi:hypothetical protein
MIFAMSFTSYVVRRLFDVLRASALGEPIGGITGCAF